MLTLVENEEYFFDEAAGDQPVRFIETFCRHFTDPFAGKPFLLHPLQKQIARDLYGWKRRDTGLLRFTECYWEGAVGCGKSPTLAALGLYALIGQGALGAQVYSFASDYSQARVVFNAAQKFVNENPALARRLQVVEREIRHPASGSFWRIVSGKGPGSGCNPSLTLGDEAHEWRGPTAYGQLKNRMAKRPQALMMVATNAGESRDSFCWELREKAVAALKGVGNPSLYPIIWSAVDPTIDDGGNEVATAPEAQDEPLKIATNDPEAWRAANPLIGTTIAEHKVAANCAEAMKDPKEEADFRRLYMGLWPKTAAGRWLNMGLWEQRTGKIDPEEIKDAPLYVGVDLSECDDLSAVVDVYVTARRFVIDAHFWMPKCTAEKYRAKAGIRYHEWAKLKHITLVDGPTISQAVRLQIAQHIIAKKAAHKIVAVCYDRAKAEDTIATLEAADLVCVPIGQGWGVASGCNALERRMLEDTIAFSPNQVLRFCATNTEVKCDERGNFWPVKPNQKGPYKGKRSAKIDGITALVTALTEARKHSFPVAKKKWKGQICLA